MQGTLSHGEPHGNSTITASTNNQEQKPPSVRYFQIHFEFLQEQLQSLHKNQETLQLQLMRLERLLLQRENSPSSKDK